MNNIFMQSNHQCILAYFCRNIRDKLCQHTTCEIIVSTCEIYLECRGQEYATIPIRMSVLYDINNNIKTKSRIIDKSKTNCTHLFFYRNETITLIDLYVVLHPIDSKYMYMCVYSILCTCIKALYCFLVDEQF